MSSTEKTLLWIGALIVVIGGIWWLTSPKGMEKTEEGSPNATSTVATSTGSAASAASDTSDSAINADIGAMGTQMDGLSSDSAAVNSSLSDKPIAQ